MSRCSFELVSSHINIIFKIFQHLAFVDQLRLSRVSGQLKRIFETYIWKEKYRTLTVLERTNEFVVSNETDQNRLCLSPEELHEFLKSYAANVLFLIIRNTVLDIQEYAGMNELTQGLMIANQQLDIRQFHLLHSIKYYSMKIPMDHLKLVAELYPFLQELQLQSCSIEEYINAVIDDIVPQLKSLRVLSTADVLLYDITFGQLYELASKRSMECLKFNVSIEPEENVLDLDTPPYTNRVNLKELSLRTCFDPQKWSNNYPLFLNMFKSLVSLNLEFADKVTDKILTTIAETCKYLEVFSIQYSTFQKIKLFLVPPKVSSLKLYWCKGITHRNLMQILSLSKVRQFYSGESYFEGAMETFQISPLIESLNIDGVVTEAFKSIYENNEHLKQLTWYSNSHHNVIVNVKSLVTCKNLHTLEMHDSHLHIDILLQLQALHKFIMLHPAPSLSWPYILDLLKHPTLKEICIRDSTNSEYHKMNANIPQEAFATNVTLMEIPLDMFEFGIGFWFDVFSRNKNLKRIRGTFYPSEDYEKFLRTAINHPNFPRALKTISFCGVTINCNDFRRNFDVNIKKLHKYSDSGRYRYLYYDGKPFIAFERPTSDQTKGSVCPY